MFDSFKPPALRAVDAGIAVLLGVLFAALSAWIIAPQVMFTEGVEPYIAPNFGEYCEILGLWSQPDGEWKAQPLRRSMFASLPAHLFVESLGVIDALGTGALLCAVVLGASLYLWACALGGRLAGIMAVVAALTTESLPLMTRHFTFYPAIIACFALSSALCAWATMAEHRTRPAALLCAATGLGASLLVDVRGIIWAAPMLLLLLFITVRTSDRRKRCLCLLLLCAPLWTSHQFGEWNAGGMQVVSLEEQVDVRPLAHIHGARGPGLEPPFDYPSRFFWGVSKLTELPETLQFLANQLDVPGVNDVRSVRSLETKLFENKIAPWERGAIAAFILVLVGMRKNPRALLALVLTGIPYAAAQLGVHAHHEVRVRFLMQTFPLLAVLYGLATSQVLAWLLQGVGHTQSTARALQARRAPLSSPLWPVMGGLLALLCTANAAGWIPGPLHMDATWRAQPWHFVNGHIALYKRMLHDHQSESVFSVDPWQNDDGSQDRWDFREATCNPLLSATSREAGGAFQSRLYAPLDRHRSGQAQPEAGFAPSMSTQSPR